MKKQLFCFLFLLSGIACFGQKKVYPYPLPMDTATWTCAVFGQPYPYGCGDNTGYCSSYKYRMAGDTLVAGIPHKKLYSTGSIKFGHDPTGNPYYIGDSTYHIYIGALRQDTLGLRAYLCLPNTITDTLLYDYNLHLGDTLRPSYVYTGSYGSTGFVPVVSKIDTFLVGSVYYKRFFLDKNNTNPPFGPSLIRGIGNNAGPTERLYLFFEGGIVLNCFNKNAVSPSFNGSDCSAYFSPTGIEEQTKPLLLIGANPSEGLFAIQSASSEKQFFCTIYATDGREVYSGMKSGNGFTIDLRNQPRGIYFLQARSGIVVWSAKLLVQ